MTLGKAWETTRSFVSAAVSPASRAASPQSRRPSVLGGIVSVVAPVINATPLGGTVSFVVQAVRRPSETRRALGDGLDGARSSVHRVMLRGLAGAEADAEYNQQRRREAGSRSNSLSGIATYTGRTYRGWYQGLIAVPFWQTLSGLTSEAPGETARRVTPIVQIGPHWEDAKRATGEMWRNPTWSNIGNYAVAEGILMLDVTIAGGLARSLFTGGARRAAAPSAPTRSEPRSATEATEEAAEREAAGGSAERATLANVSRDPASHQALTGGTLSRVEELANSGRIRLVEVQPGNGSTLRDLPVRLVPGRYYVAVRTANGIALADYSLRHGGHRMLTRELGLPPPRKLDTPGTCVGGVIFYDNGVSVSGQALRYPSGQNAADLARTLKSMGFRILEKRAGSICGPNSSIPSSFDARNMPLGI